MDSSSTTHLLLSNSSNSSHSLAVSHHYESSQHHMDPPTGSGVGLGGGFLNQVMSNGAYVGGESYQDDPMVMTGNIFGETTTNMLYQSQSSSCLPLLPSFADGNSQPAEITGPSYEIASLHSFSDQSHNQNVLREYGSSGVSGDPHQYGINTNEYNNNNSHHHHHHHQTHINNQTNQDTAQNNSTFESTLCPASHDDSLGFNTFYPSSHNVIDSAATGCEDRSDLMSSSSSFSLPTSNNPYSTNSHYLTSHQQQQHPTQINHDSTITSQGYLCDSFANQRPEESTSSSSSPFFSNNIKIAASDGSHNHNSQDLGQHNNHNNNNLDNGINHYQEHSRMHSNLSHHHQHEPPPVLSLVTQHQTSEYSSPHSGHNHSEVVVPSRSLAPPVAAVDPSNESSQEYSSYFPSDLYHDLSIPDTNENTFESLFSLESSELLPPAAPSSQASSLPPNNSVNVTLPGLSHQQQSHLVRIYPVQQQPESVPPSVLSSSSSSLPTNKEIQPPPAKRQKTKGTEKWKDIDSMLEQCFKCMHCKFYSADKNLARMHVADKHGAEKSTSATTSMNLAHDKKIKKKGPKKVTSQSPLSQPHQPLAVNMSPVTSSHIPVSGAEVVAGAKTQPSQPPAKLPLPPPPPPLPNVTTTSSGSNDMKAVTNASASSGSLHYMCSECNRTFLTLDECKQHMASDHKITQYNLITQNQTPTTNNAPVPQTGVGCKLAPKGPLPESGSSLAPVVTSGPTEDKADPDEVDGKVKVVKKRDKNPSKKKAWNVKMMREQSFFACEKTKCSCRFSTVDNLDEHEKCHQDNGLGFACYHCNNYQSESWNSMAGHLWRKHRIDLDLFKCGQCDYRSYSLSVLENIHRKIHSTEKNYVCTVCSKGFKNAKQLVNHKSRHSDVKKEGSAEARDKPRELYTHVCDLCSKAFPDARPLRIHKDLVHKKKRLHNCHHCGHSAATKGALRVHIRSHTGEKPFKCEECEYSTSDHNSLRRHKMRHSGERPYKCPFCDYACIQSSTYKQHLRNKHPNESEGVMFTCECGFRTVNEEIFRTHRIEHQKLASAEIDPTAASYRVRHPRSDGESSSSSSICSSSSPTPLSSSGPESPVMQLTRGIIGSSFSSQQQQQSQLVTSVSNSSSKTASISSSAAPVPSSSSLASVSSIKSTTPTIPFLSQLTTASSTSLSSTSSCPPDPDMTVNLLSTMNTPSVPATPPVLVPIAFLPSSAISPLETKTATTTTIL